MTGMGGAPTTVPELGWQRHPKNNYRKESTIMRIQHNIMAMNAYRKQQQH
jgi:hypothetical protein